MKMPPKHFWDFMEDGDFTKFAKKERAMPDKFNDKHLLWWIMRAIDACRANGTTRDTLLSETTWANLGAPNWVLPAIREKYEEFPYR